MTRIFVEKWVLGLLVIVAPFFYKFTEQGVFGLLYIVFLGIGILFLTTRKIRCAVSLMDLVVILYIIYGIINLLFVRDIPVDNSWLLQWILLICIYILSRNIHRYGWLCILYCISFAGIIQAGIGLAQLLELQPSNHSEFWMTGSFPNPGPYGGFLSISLLATLTILTEKLKNWSRIILVFFAIFILCIFVVVDSRAGYLAFTSGFLYFIFDRIPKKYRNKYVIGAVVFAIFFTVILYYYRMGSVDSRLLIWRVCMNIFRDNPFLGNGVASLPAVYMNYQADYFIHHPGSGYIAVANNHYQAFNEFIHLGCEQGIIGLILFFMIILLAFKSKGERRVKTLFLSLLVFSFFSYPADILSLKIFFPFCIGMSAENRFFSFRLSSWGRVVPLLLIPVIVYLDYYYYKVFREIEFAERPALPYNYPYMSRFTKTNSLKHKDLQVFKYTTTYVVSTSEMLCDMGDIYFFRSESEQADSCYQKAYNMLPNRILPLFKLFLLYKDTDTTKALIYAYKIKDFTPKLVTSVSLRAKHQSKEYIKQHTPRL